MEYSEIIYRVSELVKTEFSEFNNLTSGAKIKKISAIAKRTLRDSEEASELKKLLDKDKKYKAQYDIKTYHELLNTTRLESFISLLNDDERKMLVAHMISMLEEGLKSNDVAHRIDISYYINLICAKIKSEDVASEILILKEKASELIKGISAI